MSSKTTTAPLAFPRTGDYGPGLTLALRLIMIAARSPGLQLLWLIALLAAGANLYQVIAWHRDLVDAALSIRYHDWPVPVPMAVQWLQLLSPLLVVWAWFNRQFSSLEAAGYLV